MGHGAFACFVMPEVRAPLPYPHLAIPSLVSFLRAHGQTEVRQLDLSQPGSAVPWNPLLAASLVGISIAYPEQLFGALALAREIRRRNSETVLIVGGATVTARIHSLIANPDFTVFDALVAGDGEEPARQLIERARKGDRDLSGIPNCYSRNGETFEPPGAEFNLLPSQYGTPEFPDRHYDKLPIRMGKGCFWRRCAFCTYKSVFDGYLRPQVDVAVHQIRALQERHGTRHFVIVDDSIPARTLERFANKLAALALDVQWECSAVFDKSFRRPEIAAALARARCTTIFFGFESANPRVLGLMGKMNELPTVQAILTNLSRAGVLCHLNVMIGFPSETWREANQTICFLRRHRQLYGNFHAQTFSLEEESDVFRFPRKFSIRRVQVENGTIDGARVGHDFECSSGMNRTRRNFMTLRCQLAYRKPGMAFSRYVRKRAELIAYALRHPLGMLLNR